MHGSHTAEWLGKSLPLTESRRHLSGRGTFIGDLKNSGMLRCVFLRSPYAHARINRLDCSRALAQQGVVAVFTGRDFESKASPLYTMVKGQKYYGIAVDKVRYVSEPVALVVAESVQQALDAAELVEVDYEPLQAVVDPEKAEYSAPLHEELGSNLVLSRTYSHGDVDSSLLRSDEVVQATFHFDRYASSPIECCGVTVEYFADGELVIHDNQQTPALFHEVISDALRVPSSSLRFIESDIGGGFGVKVMLYPYVFLLAFAALQLKKSLMWEETRIEHLTGMAHNTNRVFKTQLGLSRDGKITVLKTEMIEDCGAYVRLPDPGGVIRSLMTFTGCYDIRNVEVVAKVVTTNKCPTGPVRGYGCPQAYFMLERVMDMAARKLGVSPAEIRFKNFVGKEEQPYKTVFGSLYDGGDYEACLRKALDLANPESLKTKSGKGLLGVGIATVVEPAVTNLARNKLLDPSQRSSGSGEAAAVWIDPGGCVTASLASVPQGQGHATVASQLVADILGIRPDQVKIVKGDTGVVYPSVYGGTWGSRFSVMTMGALKRATLSLRAKVLEVAGSLLDASPSRLQLRDGRVYHVGSDRSVGLRDVARAAYRDTLSLKKGLEPGLHAHAFYEFPAFSVPDKEGKLNMAATYGNSAHVAVVEVDPESFAVKVLKYFAVHDCGRVLNPAVVEGQIVGGVVQGIGSSLYEAIVYSDDGQPLVQTLADYCLPSTQETPPVVVEHMETSSLFSELGAKGMGEGPMIPVAAAIANAVEDALYPLGVRITRSHLTPEYLWSLAGKGERHTEPQAAVHNDSNKP
jgi:2-furoyl-CoA dehydrogenase large subunit